MMRKHGVSPHFLKQMKKARDENPQKDYVHINLTPQQVKDYNEFMKRNNPAYLLAEWRRLTKGM